MKTQTKYEEIFLSEIRSLPMPVLPQALKMLRLFKESMLNVTKPHSSVQPVTGFCGAWCDDRNSDEIIDDIVAHRSGFGGRGIEL